MKNTLKTGFIFIMLALALPLAAQSSSSSASSSTGTTSSTGFDMTDFPQWSKDLRRGEIVAFGSFPFTLYFSTVAMDTYRMANHGWDRRYAPYPFKAAGSVSMTQQEHLLTLGIAVGSSILIAVADHLIVRYRRNKQAREISTMPAGTPIIIKRPEESSGEGAPLSGETP